jgi:DNA-binding PadR family transcriptional regulator
MSVENAVLGFLLGGPLSGYDLKKLIGASESLPWSGNNNQVYTALVQLHRDGLVSKETQERDLGPIRKVYTITEEGKQALKTWVMSEVELSEHRMPILSHLISADLLSDAELDELLGAYAEQLQMKILTLEEMQRREAGPSFGSSRQRFIWQVINQCPLEMAHAEAVWLEEVRSHLKRPRGNAQQ